MSNIANSLFIVPLLILLGCSLKTEAPSATRRPQLILNVLDQPYQGSVPSAGLLVAVQAFGGTHLEVSITDGRLRLPPESESQSRYCLTVGGRGVVRVFEIKPAPGAQAALHAKLVKYEPPAADAQDASGMVGKSGQVACQEGTEQQNKTKFVGSPAAPRRDAGGEDSPDAGIPESGDAVPVRGSDAAGVTR